MKKNWFFLRGLVRESGHWSGFLEKFSQAFPETNVIPLDLPGSGVHFREDCPKSVAGMVDVLRRDFLPQKGTENYLFCLSLGAMAAFDWMHRFEDFQGAAFVNTSLRGLSPFHQRLNSQNYGKILKILFSSDIHFRERSILELTSHSVEQFPKLTEEWVKIQGLRPVSRKNAVRQLLAAAKFHPPLERPKGTLLLLNGKGDTLVSPKCSEAISRLWQIPLEAHPTAGHDLTLDAADWTLEKIRQYFFK